ncbi:MAG TPA: phosphoribosyltransferase family protein [Trinickia sp.]|uniref:phosphoribosyltransferase n=1 Tax=Trinickia sp. TaxID=2571163 RepID=UPI002BCD5D59|nr:phosphoribosyltransferase family protein [Trinickia sp.]HVW51268.1 phosphoribosyltransferase family protein [Trinickia sp.]
MIFADRKDAAEQLALSLDRYRGHHPLILAIPRGALVMGSVLAARLQGELDVVLVRKLRAPFQPELAIGAIDETGWTYLSEHIADLGISDHYLEAEKQHQLEVLHVRRSQYSAVRPPADPAGRVVIVVDDGLATGATMIAALHAVRAANPATLICAVPVAAQESLEHVRRFADLVVCLQTPPAFYAVGEFYRSFSQVDDDEAIQILKQATLLELNRADSKPSPSSGVE